MKDAFLRNSTERIWNFGFWHCTDILRKIEMLENESIVHRWVCSLNMHRSIVGYEYVCNSGAMCYVRVSTSSVTMVFSLNRLRTVFWWDSIDFVLCCDFVRIWIIMCLWIQLIFLFCNMMSFCIEILMDFLSNHNYESDKDEYSLFWLILSFLCIRNENKTEST